ncbi:MAG: hypothetical protein Ct9H300mP8_10650 [Gammaproteobacteria bacterium]|nr:MAG: hypothetical protein Ct9H300mP8_10650 [Gammaproteobacteria bacterium]
MTVFIQHTSASPVIQENAGPRVLADLQAWMDRSGFPKILSYMRIVPRVPMTCPRTSELQSRPPCHHSSDRWGPMALGTWQGIFSLLGASTWSKKTARDR